jgi:hypothetical protein
MDILFEKLFSLVPLSTLTFLLNVLTIGILYLGIRPWLMELATQVTKTNGSVTNLNAWRVAHDKQDDERHDEQSAHLRDIKDELRDLRRP